jgi:TatD DNase family protein
VLIDTHCHLTSEELSRDLAGVLERARAAGVRRVITIATDPTDARRAIELATAHAEVSFAAGIHPHQAARVTTDDLAALGDLHHGNWNRAAGAPEPLAVGETGLDFHYDFALRERQEEVFRFQLELASEMGRPVILHARRAEERVCEILSEFPALSGRAVFHCFSGGVELARRVLDGGWWVSFTGVVTFRGAGSVRAAARFVPAERFMVETDAPYLSPEPVRKVRPCEPAFVAHTARFLAELRGVSFEELAEQTTRNAERFFRLREVG